MMSRNSNIPHYPITDSSSGSPSSSSSSSSPAAASFLSQAPALHLLRSFSVTPYCAWAHPNAPVYAPHFVTLSLWLPTQDHTRERPQHTVLSGSTSEADPNPNLSSEKGRRRYCYFRDGNRPIEHKAQAQHFAVDPPVPLLPGSIIRLTFTGAYQRQTLTTADMSADVAAPATLDDYYVCLSRVTFETTEYADVAVAVSPVPDEGEGAGGAPIIHMIAS